jgi:hypothetical protein
MDGLLVLPFTLVKVKRSGLATNVCAVGTCTGPRSVPNGNFNITIARGIFNMSNLTFQVKIAA